MIPPWHGFKFDTSQYIRLPSLGIGQRAVEKRVAEVVARDCLNGPTGCGWPECGCNPSVPARDLLSLQPST